MQIDVIDPQFQTALFTLFLVGLTVITAKKDHSAHEMNHSHTNELKGIAILMVIFSHIGYFLFSDHTFLYPLSVAGGVGVNIFLFLSGFGLTSSEIKSKKSILSFYIKRMKNIYIPMWIILILVLILDAYLLDRTYSVKVIVQSFLGFFPNGDIDSAVNSPLWYFSLILFYYLIFPIVYRKNWWYLSIAAVFFLGYYMVNLKLPVTKDVLKLYELHYIAFPLGMLFAHVYEKKPGIKLKEKLVNLVSVPYTLMFARYFLILLLAALFGYTAIHSGVGEELIVEQLTSLVTMFALVLILLLKDFHSDLLITLGKYSYEIYLIQWPLMYRYDFIYKYTPAFVGTLLYIAVFISIGFVLNKVVKNLKLA